MTFANSSISCCVIFSSSSDRSWRFTRKKGEPPTTTKVSPRVVQFLGQFVQNSGMNEGQRAALIQKATDGDGGALQSLIVEYHGALRANVERRISATLRGRLDPDDVLQDAYIAVFRTVAGLDFDGPAAFYAWLGRTAFTAWLITNARLPGEEGAAGGR